MVLYDDKKWMCRLIRTAFTLEDDSGEFQILNKGISGIELMIVGCVVFRRVRACVEIAAVFGRPSRR